MMREASPKSLSPFTALALAAFVAAPRLASAQEPPPGYTPMPPGPGYPPAPGYAPMPPPPPPTGTGMVITGAIFTSIGGLNLITAPLCKTSLIRSNIQTACLGLSLGFGIAFAGVGVPLLVVGVNRRNAYLEWKRQHNVIGRLTDLSLTPTPGGAAVTWQTAF